MSPYVPTPLEDSGDASSSSSEIEIDETLGMFDSVIYIYVTNLYDFG